MEESEKEEWPTVAWRAGDWPERNTTGTNKNRQKTMRKRWTQLLKTFTSNNPHCSLWKFINDVQKKTS